MTRTIALDIDIGADASAVDYRVFLDHSVFLFRIVGRSLIIPISQTKCTTLEHVNQQSETCASLRPK